ncbi:YjbF family lipoprotein [uncultured Pseudacidovorax sp.]|uniref:YjbF family lipoprotein n=1 Tax=uncultured Pseudacidovorax sp. TaxID=679313 RepID=UPI0025FA6953|nr:YjbF family lipoprotein [uncultured Pseudacidovorax sp.]
MRPLIVNPRPFCCAFTALLLTACSTGGGAITESGRYLFNDFFGRTDSSTPSFDPALSYLRATKGGAVAYLVLGYVDSTPSGSVEVWYSARREVLRLRNGRLVGTTGLDLDWRASQTVGLPSWQTLMLTQQEASYRRTRDIEPTYQFGIDEQIRIVRLASYKPIALQSHPSASLTWFEEHAESLVPGAASLPPSRFGVAVADDGSPYVVYSEQCLSADVCYSFERLQAPPATAAAAAAGS